jgi:hypothetical protein
MTALRALLVAVALLAASAPVALAQSACAAIADRGARLDCYDRAGRAPRPAFAPPRSAAPDLSTVCTRASPCVGPRGGVYYITSSGYRRYLPRR